MRDMTKTKDIRIEEFKALMFKALSFSPIETNNAISKLDEIGFFDAPASTKYHGAYSGGLFDHSKEVTEQLVNLTEKLGLKWERERSPYIVGMFHDLCKCDTYKLVPERGATPEHYEFNKDTLLNGHGEKSVIIAHSALLFNLTNEEIACIRWHMGAFDDKDNWSYYRYAITQYPNVLYTHTADMIASAIYNV